jgi:hypothetical protein
VHTANLLMSMLSSGQFSIKIGPEIVATRSLEIVSRMVDGNGKYRPNPCSFYLLNLAIDVSPSSLGLILGLQVLIMADNNRHSNPHLPPPNPNRPLPLHPHRQSTRIHQLRQLRHPAPRMVVVQTIHHLLHGPNGHENLRPDHLPRRALDLARR